MRRDPRVALLCYDATHPLRYLEVRGVAEEMRDDGALQHLDELASRYVGRPVRYFGECIPASFATSEVPVLCLIRPTSVTAVDARVGMPPANARAGRWPDTIETGVPDPVSCDVGPPPSSPLLAGASRGSGANGPGPCGPQPSVPIPESHRDLLERPICGVLTTLQPDGQPRSCLVWVGHDGRYARLDTTMQRQGGRDLANDPRLSLLVVDPADTSRFMQIRGRAELVTDGAVEHLDALTRRYTSHPRYRGCVYPLEQAAREQRVSVRIHARRITLDAIHA